MKGRITLLCWALTALMGLGGCRQTAGDCVVKGTVKGVRDGTRVELTNEWDDWKVVGKGVVRDGAFEIQANSSDPAHVYLYVHKGKQLKDFFLEPGTILVDATVEDESLLFTGATGTPINDLYHRYLTQEDIAQAIKDSVMTADPAGPLALKFASSCDSSTKALRVLDRLTPELAGLPFVAKLREELTRRAKTEPREEDSDFVPVYIDMEYPDADGNTVKLSDVVNDPANRYVLLDFWATWCDPCREAIPGLRELYAEYHEKGLEIYSVSEDPDVKDWKPFLKENGMVWINVLDTEAGRKSKMWNAYALRGVPTTLLIDGNTGEILVRNSIERVESILSGQNDPSEY